MKYTRPLNRQAVKWCLFATAALLASHPAAANPFNDGSSAVIATDTNYNGTLYIGIQKPGNDVLIDSNVTVSATDVIIGQLTSSSSNSLSLIPDALLIVGDGSTNGLTTGGVVVGGTDDGPAVSINNASRLDTDFLYLGYGTNDSGRILLEGEGTTLAVSADATVGRGGSTNAIDVESGALLEVGGILTVGGSGTTNNEIHVASGGTLFVNDTNRIVVTEPASGNGIVIGDAGTLQVGGDVNTGTLEPLGLELEDNANIEVGGALTLDRNRIDSRLNVVLNGDLSTNSASWNSGSLTVVGAAASDNSLTLTNGATGHALNILQIGQQSTASNNIVRIGGTNTSFTADTDVFVGAQGDGNALWIQDGAEMDIGGSLYLGNDAPASGNEAVVRDGATLNVQESILVGDNGSDNTLSIEGGGLSVGDDLVVGSAGMGNRYLQTGGTNTLSGSFIIGRTTDATGKTGFVDDDVVETTGNLAIVGDGSRLDIAQDLTVGLEGGGSILTLRDGGAVNVSGDAVIGSAAGDNYIYLQRDADTKLNVSGDLVVGVEGGSNRFAVYGGTANVEGSLYLGGSTNQHTAKNFIHLETTNAVLQVADTMYIGASNSVNTLDIIDGAVASAQDLLVGAFSGVSNNTVTVTGNRAMLDITNRLEIGSSEGSGNSVVVENGGILQVDQSAIVLGAGTSNILKIADGGTLKTGDWDESLRTGSATNIVLEAGSTLHLLGTLSGRDAVDGGMTVMLDGTNALWNTESNSMQIGRAAGQNTLAITNGATALTSANLEIGPESADNRVTVGGDGSQLVVGHDLLIGNEDQGESIYNSLYILDGGSVIVSNNAELARAAALKISSRSGMTVQGDYSQDRYSTLEIGISSNQAQPNLVVVGNADFAAHGYATNYPLLKVYDEGIAESNVITIVQAGSITIDGDRATTGNLSANIHTNLLLGFNVTVSNGTGNSYIVLDDFIKRTIGDAGNLQGQLLAVADEITLLEQGGNTNAMTMTRLIAGMADDQAVQAAMDGYYGEEKSSVPAHNAINMGIQSVAEQLTQRADSTRARMGTASSVIPAPSGAEGPHMEDQELQGWFTTFKTWADRDADDGFLAYDGSLGGFLIGADATVAEGFLVGVAGGSGRSSMDKENGGKSDTRTIFGTAYASAGNTDWFADASVIYGSSRIDYTLGSAFDTAANYDARNFALYFGGGKEIIGKYLIFTPQASLLGNYYMQDRYDEKSSMAVARNVDRFDAFYLQSAVGGNLGFYTVMGESLVLKPEFQAFWLHEFNAREEDVAYTLVGGTGSYNLQMQAPVSDIIKLGGGLSAKFGEYLELRADLDARMASGYSDYTLLGSIRYQF